MNNEERISIKTITYTPDNLPDSIAADQDRSIAFCYTASGKKVRETTRSRHYVPHPLLPGNTNTPNSLKPDATVNSPFLVFVDTRSYCDNLVYSNTLLQRMLIDGGYITFGIGGIPKYHFYQNDHLGNVRVVSDANGTVEEVNHYYPYGALMGESQNTTTQPYKYNGKELDRSFGLDWYDYGARWLDGVGGRWSSMDPLCEKYYDVSPYVYCAGDQVNRVDDNGRKIVFVNGFLHFGSPEGGETYWNSMFVKGAQTTFKDNATPFFTNYDFKYFESASVLREFQGYQYAKQNYKKLTEGMTHGVDKFNFVSHSMGGAFAEGMIRYLSEKGWKTDMQYS